MQPTPIPTTLPASEVLVRVTEQTVGRELTLGVTVEQPKRALAINSLPGVVTSVNKLGRVRVGDILYSVGQVPVRAVEGVLPFYRPLSYRAEGKDVRQLRNALVALGYLPAKGDTFDYATRNAVRHWQKNLGIAQTGTVELGELIAVPRLPAALILDNSVIATGGVLSGGEKIVYGATGDPKFTLLLSEQQARLVPSTATITMDHQGKHWDAVIAETQSSDDGGVKMLLRAPDGGSVCGRDCDLVSTESTLNILSRVSVVQPASGPSVPVAAITTNPDGTAFVLVVDDSGARTRREVKVKGSQDGLAVVTGIEVGEQVQVLAAKNEGATPTSAEPSPESSR